MTAHYLIRQLAMALSPGHEGHLVVPRSELRLDADASAWLVDRVLIPSRLALGGAPGSRVVFGVLTWPAPQRWLAIRIATPISSAFGSNRIAATVDSGDRSGSVPARRARALSPPSM
jgi:hypothetical protein